MNLMPIYNPAKKNILVFTHTPPLPADSGSTIYVMNTMPFLAKKYNLYLFTIGGENEIKRIQKHQALYDEYFCAIHVEPRAKMPLEKGVIGRVVHYIEHIVLGLPFMDLSFYSRSAIRNARKMVKQHNIHVMEIHSSHLAFFKRFLPGVPTLLASQNIESDLFPFWIPQHLTGWKRAMADFVARISRRNANQVELENKWDFEAMTFISMDDMIRVTAKVSKQYIPLCLPVKDIDYESKQEPPINLIWMGGFSWYPNAEGVLWFVNDIFPLIKHKLESLNIRLHFIGQSPPEELKAIHDGNHVLVHGYIESIEDLLNNAHLMFVPLLTGGGVRVKILEAMSNGIPVLSTSKGCEGLGATDGLDIVVRDDAAAFSEAILDLASNKNLRARLSENSRNLFKEKYNLKKILKQKDEIHKKLFSST